MRMGSQSVSQCFPSADLPPILEQSVTWSASWTEVNITACLTLDLLPDSVTPSLVSFCPLPIADSRMVGSANSFSAESRVVLLLKPGEDPRAETAKHLIPKPFDREEGVRMSNANTSCSRHSC